MYYVVSAATVYLLRELLQYIHIATPIADSALSLLRRGHGAAVHVAYKKTIYSHYRGRDTIRSLLIVAEGVSGWYCMDGCVVFV